MIENYKTYWTRYNPIYRYVDGTIIRELKSPYHELLDNKFENGCWWYRKKKKKLIEVD